MTWRCAGDTFSDAKISSHVRARCHVEKLLLYSARKQHCGVTGLRLIEVATASAHETLTHVGLKRGAGLPKYAQIHRFVVASATRVRSIYRECSGANT